MSAPTAAELDALEARIERAFAGDVDLEVLGYGEISSVVAFDAAGGRFAAKRLPPFPDEAAVARYRSCFHSYLKRLQACSVHPVDSRLVATSDSRVLYCLQPRLPPTMLAVTAVRERPLAEGMDLLSRIVDRVRQVCGPTLGLDAQLSNWAIDGDELAYLDVTTPLLRDSDGNEALDVELFVASLPWIIRSVVRDYVLRDILATYYDPRRATIDLLANLLKERLTSHFEAATRALGPTFSPPITAPEVYRYYRDDARTWALLQRLRRVDRAWQRRIRRRTYPFLLPGEISR